MLEKRAGLLACAVAMDKDGRKKCQDDRTKIQIERKEITKDIRAKEEDVKNEETIMSKHVAVYWKWPKSMERLA